MYYSLRILGEDRYVATFLNSWLVIHPLNGAMHTSVAPIIGSAIGIGQYRALTGISAVYLDLACRYLVFKHEL